MPHPWPLARRHQCQRRGQNLVQDPCSLTAAHHQQAQRTVALRHALFGRRHLRDRRAHRIADQRNALVTGKRSGQAKQDAARKSCQQAVGGARDRILFVHYHRGARQPRRHPARPGNKTAGSQHATRAQLPHQQRRLDDCHEQQQRCQQLLPAVLAAHTADAQVGNRYSGRRHQPRLHACASAQPMHPGTEPAQRFRGRQPREHMPASAATGDQHQRLALNHCAASRPPMRFPARRAVRIRCARSIPSSRTAPACCCRHNSGTAVSALLSATDPRSRRC